MDSTKIFLESLKQQHESFKSGDKSLESLLKDIECYESFIPEFFSKTGEADRIHAMYAGINENLDNEKSINCINLNTTANIYNEYMEGMTSFIMDISEINIKEAADALDIFKSNFNRAKENDSIFIESLYDGKLKENELVETPLSSAVTNIEYLIDFIPQLSLIKENCTSLFHKINSGTQNETTDLVNDALKMLFESVDTYCYHTISNVVSTYSDINDKLFNENTEDTIDSQPKYKLF